MRTEIFVIFDYSGTLSTDAVLFSRPDRLVEALEKTGLAGLGVATPDIFWTEIVNPSWDRGSTTGTGYGRIMEECIRERLNPAVPDKRIAEAASRFVMRYLESSSIHPRWKPLLQRIAGNEGIRTVVATDHYAEATNYIIGHLKAFGIKAFPVREGGTRRDGIAVANSADLGAHKADRTFWETLKRHLPAVPVADVLIVDDFGFNEGTGDAYSEEAKVETRKAHTTALLEDVFSAMVHPVPFMLKDAEKLSESDDAVKGIAEKISRTADLITAILRPEQ